MRKPMRVAAGLGVLAMVGSVGVLATGAPASAADSAQPVPGVRITMENISTGDGPITIELTTARTLTVACADSGDPLYRRVVVNGVKVGLRCVDVGNLTVLGSPGNDEVDVDLIGMTADSMGSNSVRLGAGDDTADIRHDGKSPIADLYGDDGNDYLSVAYYPNFAGDPCRSGADGGPGDDKILDVGYMNTEIYQPCLASLTGGAGEDHLIRRHEHRPGIISTDLDDRPIRPDAGIQSITLNTTDGDDDVLIHNDGNWGTKVAVTRAGVTRNLTMPTALPKLVVKTQAGDDSVIIDHKSVRTSVELYDSAGTDSLILRPRENSTWARGLVTQPGFGSWTYDPDAFESVKLETDWS